MCKRSTRTIYLFYFRRRRLNLAHWFNIISLTTEVAKGSELQIGGVGNYKTQTIPSPQILVDSSSKIPTMFISLTITQPQ